MAVILVLLEVRFKKMMMSDPCSTCGLWLVTFCRILFCVLRCLKSTYNCREKWSRNLLGDFISMQMIQTLYSISLPSLAGEAVNAMNL